MEDTNIQWHLGIRPALDLELLDERENLSYFRDYSLNRQALEIDLLIIKKQGSQQVANEIGRLFRKYNIIEYKSPLGQLDIDTFYKVGAYASLYKAYGHTVNGRKANEITVSIIRKAKPVKLFRYFEEQGTSVDTPYNGIYYIMDEVLFPTQIIVTRELVSEEHIWLTALSDGIQKQQLKALLKKKESFDTKFDRELADAVLEVAIKANWQAAQELRGDDSMCQALMELMEPEINKIMETVKEETRQQVTEQVTQQVTQQGIKNAITALKASGHTNDAIKTFLMMAYGITQNEADGYL